MAEIQQAQRLAAAQAQQEASHARGAQQAQQQQEQQQAQQDQRRHILNQILMPAALTRLARLAIVKPDKARSIEDRLIMQGRMGIASKFTEDQVRMMLAELESDEAAPQVVIKHKVATFDSDDEDDPTADW